MPNVTVFDPLEGTLNTVSNVALTAIGSSPNANGASLDNLQNLTLQPADGTHPGLLTAAAQTIGGDKTFVGSLFPSAGNTYDLGSVSNQWKNIWQMGTAHLNDIIGNMEIGATGASYFNQGGSRFLR